MLACRQERTQETRCVPGVTYRYCRRDILAATLPFSPESKGGAFGPVTRSIRIGIIAIARLLESLP